MQSRNSTSIGRRQFNRIRKLMPAVAAMSAALAANNAALGINGTWSFLGNGSWSVGSNWASGVVANGASGIADFSKLNITGDQTVNLDTSRTIGQLLFGDTTQSNNWTLDNNADAANVLTLNNGASQPVITVGLGSTAGMTTTISATLAGSNGFIKNGPGALQLTGSNTFTGQVTYNSGTTGTAGNGAGPDLILGSNAALGAATNLLYIDPGSNTARVRLNAGVNIPNPIRIVTSRGVLSNGILQANGTVNATFSGAITIDSPVNSGGIISGPNDTTLANFLTFAGPITISNLYPVASQTNTNNGGVTIRTGNIIMAGG